MENIDSFMNAVIMRGVSLVLPIVRLGISVLNWEWTDNIIRNLRGTWIIKGIIKKIRRRSWRHNQKMKQGVREEEEHRRIITRTLWPYCTSSK